MTYSTRRHPRNVDRQWSPRSTRCPEMPPPRVFFGAFASILACPRHVRSGGNLGNAGCPVLPVEGIRLDVIQAPKPEPRIMQYVLTDFEWVARNLIERVLQRDQAMSAR